MQVLPGNNYHGLKLEEGGALTDINFTNAKTKLACISGFKLNETDVGLEGWTIYVDLNNNSLLDDGEPNTTTATNGSWEICNLTNGTYTVCEVPQNGWTQVYPDGYHTVILAGDDKTDLNFTNTQEEGNPGTGTPGYWKNHPEAWPVENITIGGVTYTKEEAIEILKTPENGDKTYNMFSALVAAKLNVLIGNDDSCINDTILKADKWMATYGPVGSGVTAGGRNSS